MKIGLFQYSPHWENKAGNIKRITDFFEDYDGEEDLLIFPEMSLTGFTMENVKCAEDIDGESMMFFMNLAKSLNKHIMAGIIERVDDKIFNTLFHFDNNGLITARYRKIHLFSMSGEDKYFTPGDETIITKIDQVKIGLSICYDLRFPELYRRYAKEKVDILINIASWPDKRSFHWINLLRARAIENQCFMVGVNRVGTDPIHNYNGYSGFFDPMGNEIILVKDEEKLISVDLDLTIVNQTRKTLPFLDDIKMI